MTELLWLLPAYRQHGAIKAPPSFQKGRVPHRVRSSVESTSALSTPRRALHLRARCPCNVHSHWGSLCYLKTHLSGALQKRLPNSWGTPGSLGDSLPIVHNDFQCTVVCHLRMLCFTAAVDVLEWGQILCSPETTNTEA